MKQEVFSKYKVLAVRNGKGLLYRKGKLYKQNFYDNSKPLSVAPILNTKMLFLSQFRLMERALRLEPRLAFALDDGKFLLSCKGYIYSVDCNDNSVTEEMKLRNGMNNPLQFVRTAKGTVLFGEYFSNNSAESVKVFERDAKGWNEVYAFPPSTVYHIHGFAVDGDRIYILTGDKDSESAIWYTDDYFKTVNVAVKGNQKYRSCVAFPFRNGLVYATDTPLEQNYLFYICEDDGIWKSEIIAKMPGPCIYGTKHNDNYYFATSVEPNAKYEDTFRYMLTYELGDGVKDRSVHILKLNGSGSQSEVMQLKKDIWPMLLMQFGNASFVDSDSELLINPLSVKKYDGITIKLNEEKL